MNLYYCVNCAAENTNGDCKRLRGGVRRALKTISGRYSDREYNCNSLADELNTYRVDIWDTLSDNLGVNCSYLLINKRLEKAVELLARNDLPIQKVAKRSGYNSRNLRRAFKKRMGMNPTEFREALTKNEKNKKFVVNLIKMKIWDVKMDNPIFNENQELAKLITKCPNKSS